MNVDKPLDAARTRGRSMSGRALGFSLVEVLISIVVLSFGLLGMVGMHATALQGNRDARQQSTAVSLGRELAEMLRGNKDIAAKPTAGANPYLGDFAGSPLAPTTTSSCLNVGNSCPTDPSDPTVGQTAVARAQMTDWLARVEDLLPGARVVVCLDDAPFDVATGLPRWACAAGTNATMMIKIGWTRASTDRSRTNLTPLERATGARSQPSVVLPVTPGNEI